MKYNEINKKFSDKVLEYMMNGYVINSVSMTGHQGEAGKVDLVKGDELIRVYLSSESIHDWKDRDSWHGYVLYLRVGRWQYPASRCKDSWTTVWMKDLDILEETAYYEIKGNSGHTWYVETMEEAVAIQKLRYDRWCRKDRIEKDNLTSEESIEIGVKYMKRKHGYKRIFREKMRVRKNYSNDHQHAAYYVIYNDTTYYLN